MTNDELLQIYGLYKQGTTGDNTTAEPGFISTPTTKAKWNAWTAQKGKSQAQAQS